MQPLSASQRTFLRKKAHHLDPIVLIGKQGINDTVISAIDENLVAHELIKIRFNDHKDEKKELTAEVASRTECEIAGIVGHVAILFREHEEPEKRKIRLPK